MKPFNKSNNNRSYIPLHTTSEIMSGDTSGKSKVKKESSKKNFIVYLFFTLALLAALGAAGFIFYQYTQLNNQYSQLKPKVDNPTLALDEQTKAIKETVGKLIYIDPSEDISIATIKDANKFRTDNPEFFKNATNGQFLLVSAKRAILYDKDKNLIINVAPIINTPDSQSAPTPTPTVKK